MLSNRLITRKLPIILGVALLALGITGCQTFEVKNPGELALKNHDFIELWDAYNDCQAEVNPRAMQKHLKILHSAPKPISLDDSPIPMPKFIKKLTSTRNSRLAVDPRAMAASCSIHLAKASTQTADWETAIRTYQSILEQYPEPQYAFYVSEATKAIEEFTTTRPVSLPTRDSLVR